MYLPGEDKIKPPDVHCPYVSGLKQWHFPNGFKIGHAEGYCSAW